MNRFYKFDSQIYVPCKLSDGEMNKNCNLVAAIRLTLDQHNFGQNL